MDKKTYSIFMFTALLLLNSCKCLVRFVNGPPVNHTYINTFGTDFYDYGWGLDETFDGGAIIVGTKEYRDDRSRDILLVKVDEDGYGVWEKQFGNTADEEAYAVKQCLDGGYILVGYTSSYGDVVQVYIIKLDPYVNKEWKKIDGCPNLDRAYEVIETSDGHFVIVGMTNLPGISYGNDDIWLQKIDNQGNTIWRRAYGVINHEVDYDVVELEDGGFLVLGYKNFYEVSGKDIYLIRTDSEGNIQCSAIYNGSSKSNTRWTASATYDGSVAIIGTTTYFNTNDVTAMKKIFL